MKLAIVYYSQSGNTSKMAEVIANGMKTVETVEVGLFDLDKIDYNFLAESKAVIFGTPTYYANMCWQLKKWFDEPDQNCNLEGKIGGAFATANFIQGGSENAILTIINHLMPKGMLVYSGGTALGKPYVHLGPVGITEYKETHDDLAFNFGKRIAEKAKQLFPNA